MRRRTAVLISGRGSNLAALLTATRAVDFPAEIVLVVSNVREAGGLAIAKRFGIAAHVVDHKPYRKDRGAHEAAIAKLLDDSDVEIVCLAGYMRVLTPFLIKRFKGRIINVHPSLLPAFPGLHTHERALDAGVKIHGTSIHHVTEAVDEGAIIAQAAVPVLPGDDAESLGARVLKQEHVIYPLALRLLAASLGSGDAATSPPPAIVGNAADPSAVLLNPLPGQAPSP